jgi:hypothetical protein
VSPLDVADHRSGAVLVFRRRRRNLQEADGRLVRAVPLSPGPDLVSVVLYLGTPRDRDLFLTFGFGEGEADVRMM